MLSSYLTATVLLHDMGQASQCLMLLLSPVEHAVGFDIQLLELASLIRCLTPLWAVQAVS